MGYSLANGKHTRKLYGSTVSQGNQVSNRQQCSDMWEHRNEALHRGLQDQQQILHLVGDNQIQILYSGGPQNLPRDAFHFITQQLDTILGYSLWSKQQWVSVQAMQECRRQHKYGAYLSEQ